MSSYFPIGGHSVTRSLILHDIVNFPFLDDVIPRLASYGVYIGLLESAIMLRTSTLEMFNGQTSPTRVTGIINFENFTDMFSW